MRCDVAGPSVLIRLVAQVLDAIAQTLRRARRFVRGIASVRRFASRGDNFRFDPDGTYSYETIRVGNNVDLGVRPTIMATRSEIRIGDNVMFGPEVTIRGGNHKIDVIGTPMIAVMKQPGDDIHDRGVVIEDDVWIGTRAIILHGVTIGRGAVVGAGSVVTRSVPPYAIAAGNPARLVRWRLGLEGIVEHERRLYPRGRRLPVEDLKNLLGLPEDATNSATVEAQTR
jgi:acetyltransferase-like isoleucine patch superfamily enzyme